MGPIIKSSKKANKKFIGGMTKTKKMGSLFVDGGSSLYLPECLEESWRVVEDDNGKPLGVVVLQNVDDISRCFDGDVGVYCPPVEVYEPRHLLLPLGQVQDGVLH